MAHHGITAHHGKIVRHDIIAHHDATVCFAWSSVTLVSDYLVRLVCRW